MYLSLGTLNVYSSVSLALITFITGCYYTSWKSYEINALHALRECEISWCFESRNTTEETNKKAEILLRSANYWRWIYNKIFFYLRYLVSAFIFIGFFEAITFFYSLIGSIFFDNENETVNIILFIVFIIIMLYLLYFFFVTFKKAQEFSNKGQNGNVSHEGSDTDYWVPPINRLLKRKEKNDEDKNKDYNKYGIEYLVLNPLLDDRVTTFVNLLKKDHSDRELTWLDKNINVKGNY